MGRAFYHLATETQPGLETRLGSEFRVYTLANVTLGLKYLTRTNTLAYLFGTSVMKKVSFQRWIPGLSFQTL
jgi:hypothetical protein